MKRRPWLLAVAVALFALWIGYLAYLALTAGHPRVLSRPQFLVADLWVIADVDDFDKPVKVVQVAFAGPGLKGQEPERDAVLEVSNLSKCKEDAMTPGRYILPLTKEGQGYRVTAIPRSPGYGPPTPHARVYPDTPETHAQLAQLPRQ
jgi:hypothetical protein